MHRVSDSVTDCVRSALLIACALYWSSLLAVSLTFPLIVAAFKFSPIWMEIVAVVATLPGILVLLVSLIVLVAFPFAYRYEKSLPRGEQKRQNAARRELLENCTVNLGGAVRITRTRRGLQNDQREKIQERHGEPVKADGIVLKGKSGSRKLLQRIAERDSGTLCRSTNRKNHSRSGVERRPGSPHRDRALELTFDRVSHSRR